MNQVDSFGDLGIIPVVKIEKNRQVVDLTGAPLAGEHPCARITFRTQAAAGFISSMVASSQPAMLMGAWTIISLAQTRQLGAKA